MKRRFTRGSHRDRSAYGVRRWKRADEALAILDAAWRANYFEPLLSVEPGANERAVQKAEYLLDGHYPDVQVECALFLPENGWNSASIVRRMGESDEELRTRWTQSQQCPFKVMPRWSFTYSDGKPVLQ